MNDIKKQYAFMNEDTERAVKESINWSNTIEHRFLPNLIKNVRRYMDNPIMDKHEEISSLAEQVKMSGPEYLTVNCWLDNSRMQMNSKFTPAKFNPFRQTMSRAMRNWTMPFGILSHNPYVSPYDFRIDVYSMGNSRDGLAMNEGLAVKVHEQLRIPIRVAQHEYRHAYVVGVTYNGPMTIGDLDSIDMSKDIPFSGHWGWTPY